MYRNNTASKSDNMERIRIKFLRGLSEKEVELRNKILESLTKENLIVTANDLKAWSHNVCDVDRFIQRIILLASRFQIDRDINSIADGVKIDEELCGCLLIIVKASGGVLKNIFNIERVAAKAITILNAAKISFSGMNLSDVCVPEANLSYGIFDCTQFKNSDLRKVNMQGAWLRGVDFRNALVEGIHFGELPHLKLSEPIADLCYSQDGNQIAVAFGNSIALYETKTRKRIKILEGHTDCVHAVVFVNMDEGWLASGSGTTVKNSDNTIRLWKTESGVCVQILDVHKAPVTALAYNPMRQQLASGGSNYYIGSKNISDNVIRLWEFADGGSWIKVGTLEGHLSTLCVLVYSPNGLQLASGSHDGTIRLWEIGSGNCTRILDGRAAWVTTLAYRPDGKQLASGSGAYIANYDYTIRLWETEREIFNSQTLEGHSLPVRALAYSPDGASLASGGYDKIIRLWDRDGSCVRVLDGHQFYISKLAFSPDGTQLTSGGDKELRFWEVGIYYNKITENKKRANSYFVYSPDKQQLAFSDSDHDIQILKMSCGKHWIFIQNLKGHTDAIYVLAYNLEKQLISASYDKTIRFWNVENGVCAQILAWKANIRRPVAYNANTGQLAATTYKYSIELWDLNSESDRKILDPQTNSLSVLAYSMDGSQLAHDGADDTILLWKLGEEGKWSCTQILEGHTRKVCVLTYSPNAKILASGGCDNTILLWKLEEGGKWICSQILEGHTDPISALAYSPNEKILASGSEDNTIRLWEIKNKALDLTDCITNKSKYDIQLSFHVHTIQWIQKKEGDFLITGGSDFSIRYWKFISLEGGIRDLQLMWSNYQAALFSTQVHMGNIQGLSQEQMILLKQGDNNLTESKKQEIKEALANTILKVKLNIAAEQGDAEAQYTLGLCYEKGKNTIGSVTHYFRKSSLKSAKWYIKAADQGHVNASSKVKALDIQVYIKLADEAMCHNNLLEIINYYSIVVKLDPKLQSIQHDLACYYFIHSKLGNDLLSLQKSENCFQQAIQLSPHSGICTEFANFLFSEKRYISAISLLIQAIMVDKDDERLKYGQLEKVTVSNELKEEINAQGSISGKAIIFAYYLLGCAYKETRQESEFLPYLSGYVQEVEKAQEPLSYSLLGYTYKRYGLLHEASLYFKKAHKRKKNYLLAKQNQDECEDLMNKGVSSSQSMSVQLEDLEIDADPKLKEVMELSMQLQSKTEALPLIYSFRKTRSQASNAKKNKMKHRRNYSI